MKNEAESLMVPWAYIPHELFTDRRLTLAQMRVMGVIIMLCGRNQTRVMERQDISNQCGGLYRRLGEVSRITTELVALGWLTVDRLKGQRGVLRYTWHTPTEGAGHGL